MSYTYKNIITRSSITLQIIEDVALYKAELYSSAGNIFQPTDRSTDISVKVFKGLVDITETFTDIVWRRFSFDSNNVIEDIEWGKKHNGKSTITVPREEIKEKAKIQCEIYDTIAGERTLVAAESITIVDVNDIRPSTTPPENPTHGQIWLDSSTDPPVIKMWDSTKKQWISISSTDPQVRNLIRNSNFFTKNFNLWEKLDPVDTMEVKYHVGGMWAHFKQDTASTINRGISQIIKNAKKKSSYVIQTKAVKNTTATTHPGGLTLGIYSIDAKNVKTLIQQETCTLTNDPKIFSLKISTLDTTEALEVQFTAEKNKKCDFLFTETMAANSTMLTPWELAPEDVMDAINGKMNHEEIFNALTDNGKIQGIFTQKDNQGNTNFYFNASYIKTGTLKGELIDATNLVVRRKNTNIETLKVDENGEVTLNVKNFTLATDATSNVPTKDELNESIEDIDIGGRNLLADSEREVNNDGATNGEFVSYGDLAPIFDMYGLEEYTISFDLKAAKAGSVAVYCQNGSDSRYDIGRHTVKATTEYQRFSITVTPKLKDEAVAKSMLAFYGTYGTGVFPYVKFVKVEKGNKATDWTPAVEDVVAKDDIINTINSITMDQDGVKINANAVDIRGAVTFSSLGSDLSPNFIKESDTTVINGGTIKSGTLELSGHMKATGIQIYNEKEDETTLTITKEGYVSMRGDISSFNFSDTAGWKIYGNGDAVFNSGEFRSKVILPGAGMTNEGNAADSVRIYAGAKSYEDRVNAPFKVLENGEVYAMSGHFGGTFSGKLEVGNIFIEDSEETKGRASIKIKNNTNSVTHVEIAEDGCQFDTSFRIKDKFSVDKDTNVFGVLKIDDSISISKNYTHFQSNKYYFKHMALGDKLSDGTTNTEDYFAFKSKKSNQGEDFVFTNTVSGKDVNVRVRGDIVADNSVQIGKVLIKKDASGATISIV